MSAARMADENAEAALRAQVREAAARQEPVEKLREAVCALVDGMKARGSPPEKVVIAVKSAVIGEKTVRATPDLARMQDTEKLLRETLGWCLERYYGTED